MTGVGLHINTDGCDNAMLTRAVLHIGIVKPRTVDVMGAARWNELPFALERVRAASPETIITMRGWPHDDWREDGLSERQTAAAVYAWKVKPFEAMLRRLRVHVLFDNETGVTAGYGERQAVFAEMCAKADVPCTVGRTSTGNPGEDEYARLDPIIEVMQRYPGLVHWTPNEYGNPDPRSGGNVLRFERLWKRHKFLRDNPSYTHLGEFGLAKLKIDGQRVIMDANQGYASGEGVPARSMTAREYASWVIGMWKAYYKPRGVAFSVFCLGFWRNNSYSLHPDYLDEIEQAARKGELDMAELKATFEVGDKLEITPAQPKGTNLRALPALTGALIVTLKPDAVQQGKVIETFLNWLRFGTLEPFGKGGWIREDAATFRRIPATAELPPIDVPVEPPAPNDEGEDGTIEEQPPIEAPGAGTIGEVYVPLPERRYPSVDDALRRAGELEGEAAAIRAAVMKLS